MRLFDAISRSTIGRGLLAGLALAVATMGVLAVHGQFSTTRVAIRVSCADPAPCVLAESLAIDVWTEHRGPGLPLDVVVTRESLDELAAAGISWQVLVPDIDAVAAAEAARLRGPAARGADWFGEYHDYGAITSHLRALAEAAPDVVQLEAIGSSLDNRPIWALRIGGEAPGATPMLVDGTLHAREWIAAMVATCVADRLVQGRDRDPAIRAFVEQTRLWVVPVVNPDGYQYTWSTDRYWRKNRRDRHGVDLNRNFSVGFGGAGSSGRKGSDVYHGPYAFSEPETSALRALALRERIALHVDFHAYGQLLLYPWGYTGTPARDRDRFAAFGDRMASAMFAAHDTPYRLSSAIEFYPASGTMLDWMYGEVGALSYTIELRPGWPGGARGFVLPPEQIKPTCDEGLAAVLALRAAQ